MLGIYIRTPPIFGKRVKIKFRICVIAWLKYCAPPILTPCYDPVPSNDRLRNIPRSGEIGYQKYQNQHVIVYE